MLPFLAPFNKGRAVEENGQKLWECDLCGDAQLDPEQKSLFAVHCNTKEHRKRLQVASDIVDKEVNVSKFGGLVRDIPRKVRRRIGY